MKSLLRIGSIALLTLVLVFWGTVSTTAKKLKYAIVLGEDKWYHAIDENGHILADSLSPASLGFYVYRVSEEGMFPYIRNYLMGFKNYHNKLVIPPIYLPITNSKLREEFYRDSKLEEEVLMTRFQQGKAVVLSPSRKYFGLINTQGQLLLDTVYDYIGPPQPNGVRPARRGDTLLLLNKEDSNVLSYPYRCDPVLTPVPRFGDGLLAVMVRTNGIPYRDFSALTKGGSWEKDGGPKPSEIHNYKVGFVDTAGHLVIDTIYKLSPRILHNRENEREVYRGCMSDRIAFEPLQQAHEPADPYSLEHKDCYIFSGGRCLVIKENGFFVINTHGDSLYSLPREEIRGTTYQNVRGNFIVTQIRWLGFNAGVINREGKVIVPFRKHNVQDGGKGFFLVGQSQYYHKPLRLYSETKTPLGNKLFALTHRRTLWEHYKREDALRNSGEYGLNVVEKIDRKGKTSLKGMRNKAGQWFIPPIYKGLKPFVEGRAAFCDTKANLWGFLNPDGSVAIPGQYKEVTNFQETEVQE